MSGIKVTSIFGSLINLTMLQLAIELSGIQVDVEYIAVLGDDLDLQV